MAIAQTKAAEYMQKHENELSSHQVISLLMEGALERLDQAKQTKDEAELELLLGKLMGIINGLRGLLNLEQGGEIASNLNTLYGYMIQRLEENDSKQALPEVKTLITRVKSGWDAMDVAEKAIAS